MISYSEKHGRLGATLLVLSAQAALWTAPICAQGDAAPAVPKPKKAPDGFFEQVIGEQAPKPGVATELTVLPVAALRAVRPKTTNYPVPAGALFASPDGKGDGATLQNPASLQKAIERAPHGATVVLRGGDYRGVEMELPRRMTLQAFPGEKPVLKGSEIVTGWVKEGSAWRKSGWKYKFPQNVADEHINPKWPLSVLRDMMFVNGDPLVQVGKREDVAAGRFFVDYAGDALYMGDDPNGKVVEATNRATAILIKQKFPVQTPDESNPSGSAIRGLSFLHYAEMGVGIAAENVTIEDSLFLWNGFQGLGLGPHIDSSPQITKPQGNSPKNAIVRGNTFAGNGERGVVVHGGANLRFEKNLVSYNNVEWFRQAWGAAGIKIARTSGMVLRDNIVEHNRAAAIWMDISVNKSVVSNNIVRNNQGLGIFTELSHDILVASNLVTGNNVGIMNADSSKIRIVNNTLVDNKTGIVVKDSVRLNKDEKQIAEGIAWIARDVVIQNNVIAASKPDAILFTAAESWTNSASGEMISALDNNLYSAPAATAKQFRWSPAKGKEGTYYPTLSAYKTASGRDSKSLALLSTPQELFLNAAGGDFRLRPGVVAPRTGQALPPEDAKALSRPVASGQIGAF